MTTKLVKRCEFLAQTANGRWVCNNIRRCDMPCQAKDRSFLTPENRDDVTFYGRFTKR